METLKYTLEYLVHWEQKFIFLKGVYCKADKEEVILLLQKFLKLNIILINVKNLLFNSARLNRIIPR